MGQLLLGLFLFFGPHAIRVVAPNGRARLLDRLGEGGYKGLYSVLSLAGLILISRGYSAVRGQSELLFVPPAGVSHLALLLVPLAIVLVAAAYAPAGHIKRLVRHPMIAGVGLWAFAHLLANGRVVDLVLFGAFLVWAVADYVVALRREPRPVTGPVTARGDVIAFAIGAVVTAFLLAGGHLWLIGVSPVS